MEILQFVHSYCFHFQTQKHPEYKGPRLGPKMADENMRNFTEEDVKKLRETQVGLQAGYNKGASQSGHGGFGNTRHMWNFRKEKKSLPPSTPSIYLHFLHTFVDLVIVIHPHCDPRFLSISNIRNDFDVRLTMGDVIILHVSILVNLRGILYPRSFQEFRISIFY